MTKHKLQNQIVKLNYKQITKQQFPNTNCKTQVTKQITTPNHQTKLQTNYQTQITKSNCQTKLQTNYQTQTSKH